MFLFLDFLLHMAFVSQRIRPSAVCWIDFEEKTGVCLFSCFLTMLFDRSLLASSFPRCCCCAIIYFFMSNRSTSSPTLPFEYIFLYNWKANLSILFELCVDALYYRHESSEKYNNSKDTFHTRWGNFSCNFWSLLFLMISFLHQSQLNMEQISCQNIIILMNTFFSTFLVFLSHSLSHLCEPWQQLS